MSELRVRGRVRVRVRVRQHQGLDSVRLWHSLGMVSPEAAGPSKACACCPPNIVKVFPVPVCPYAKMVLLKPRVIGQASGWVGVRVRVRSTKMVPLKARKSQVKGPQL